MAKNIVFLSRKDIKISSELDVLKYVMFQVRLDCETCRGSGNLRETYRTLMHFLRLYVVGNFSESVDLFLLCRPANCHFTRKTLATFIGRTNIYFEWKASFYNNFIN